MTTAGGARMGRRSPAASASRARRQPSSSAEVRRRRRYEGAQKIFGGRFSLLRVAFDAAGNGIAAGIAASAGPRGDMVDDSPTSDEAPLSIKKLRTLTRQNGIAAAADLQEGQPLAHAA